ncbi:MAG: sigma-70 family RNA polymerase sigma factor [Anaerolineales bacterium]|nr:sigma-70 family RNA polymerase sigma factor [Anaerolineales bacterium]
MLAFSVFANLGLRLVLSSKFSASANRKQQHLENIPSADGQKSPSFDENDALNGLREMNPQAISTIHSFYYPDIYRFASFRLNDVHLAEDLTAEVFMRLLVAVKEGHGPRTTLRGWLMATASNMINDYYRKSYRRKTEELSDELRADAPSPLVRVEIQERHKAVHAALEKLTPDQQNILSLRFSSGYSLEETAEAIGKNINAVKQLQFRALAALRRHLGDEI